MKKCPYCAEEIQDDAVKCKHCGEWLEKNVKESPHQVVEVKKIEPPEAQPLEKVVSSEPDEEIKRKKEAGLKECPSCGNWDAYTAIVEDGGYGDCCPHCKNSLINRKDTLISHGSDIDKVNNNNTKQEPNNWGNLLVLIGLLLHLIYGIITVPDTFELIGSTCGRIAFSMIFVPAIRPITKTQRYFTHTNIAIALYIGFITILLLKVKGY